MGNLVKMQTSKSRCRCTLSADNRHLTYSNIFPCTLILLYAETGKKPKDVYGTSDNQSAHFDF